METLDTVFCILFARYRRQYSGALRLTYAWHRASGTMVGYLALPIAGIAVVIIITAYAATGKGAPLEHQQMGELTGVALVLASSVLLHRRFQKYLACPPAIAAHESAADTRYLRCFRVAALGLLLAISFVGFVLHRAGFLQGI